MVPSHIRDTILSGKNNKRVHILNIFEKHLEIIDFIGILLKSIISIIDYFKIILVNLYQPS